jgi:hypothetical protein
MAEKKQCEKCGQVIDPDKKYSWGHNLLLSFDQFGNTLSGGNPDSTISARVGYFANQGISESKYPGYWKLLEKMINFAWWPYERDNHCKDAYDADPETPYPGNGLMKIVLFIIALFSSVIVSTLLYFSWLLFPSIRNRDKCESCRGIVKLYK